MAFGDWGQHWAVLIGDLVDSRGAADRAAVQRQLQATLDQANERLANLQHGQGDPSHYKGLAGRIQITVGDEFQGIFAWPDDALRTAIDIWEALAPQKVAFGLGWGRLETDLDRQNVGRMDGACFHNARQALDTARARGHMIVAAGFGTPSDLESAGSPDRDINAILGLAGAVRSRWTPRQTQTVRVVRQHRTRQDAARALSVKPSTVTESLQASLFSEVDGAERSAASLLCASAVAVRRGRQI